MKQPWSSLKPCALASPLCQGLIPMAYRWHTMPIPAVFMGVAALLMGAVATAEDHQVEEAKGPLRELALELSQGASWWPVHVPATPFPGKATDKLRMQEGPFPAEIIEDSKSQPAPTVSAWPWMPAMMGAPSGPFPNVRGSGSEGAWKTLTDTPPPSLPGFFSLPAAGPVAILAPLPGYGLAASVMNASNILPGPVINVWANASSDLGGGFPSLALNTDSPTSGLTGRLLDTVRSMVTLSNGVLVAGGSGGSGQYGVIMWSAPTTKPGLWLRLPGNPGNDYSFQAMAALPNGGLMVQGRKNGFVYYEFWDNVQEGPTTSVQVGAETFAISLLSDGSVLSVTGERSWQVQWWPSIALLRSGVGAARNISFSSEPSRDSVISISPQGVMPLPSGGFACCGTLINLTGVGPEAQPLLSAGLLYLWNTSDALKAGAPPVVVRLEAPCWSLLAVSNGSFAAGLGLAGAYSGPALLKVWPNLDALMSNQGVLYQVPVPGPPASSNVFSLANLPGGRVACATLSFITSMGTVVVFPTSTPTTTTTTPPTTTATKTATTTTTTGAPAAPVPACSSSTLPWALFVTTLVLLLAVSAALGYTKLAAAPAQAQRGVEMSGMA